MENLWSLLIRASLVVVSLTNGQVSDNFQALRFALIDRSNASNVVSFPLDKAADIKTHPLFDQVLPTVFYSFGYTETINDPLMQVLRSAYEKNKRHNLILVDYGAYTSQRLGPPSIADYLTVVENIKLIGPLVGDALWRAFGSGLARNFQLVGHSMGAHLSAKINRAIAAIPDNSFGIKIPLIIALDPAAPLFFPFGNSTTINEPLNRKDADAVHVIHTDSAYFGAPVSVGTVDYWPNGGSNQTGCPAFNVAGFITDLNNFCSHQRSVLYFAEAMASQSLKTFLAVKCRSWDSFKKRQCMILPFSFVNMGLYPTFTRGDFYLQTASMPPYSLGVRGLFFNATAN